MQRVIAVPVGYTVTGEYGVDLRSGVMAAGLAADSEIYHFRWTAATTALVTEVRMWAGTDNTLFTARWYSFRMFAARSWTVDGTGGATATLTGNNHKLRTGMLTTNLGTARIATTSALGAGTKTLDAQALASIGGNTDLATAISMPPQLIFDGTKMGPLTLATNEGFSLVANVPPTGVWVFGICVRYEESKSYPH